MKKLLILFVSCAMLIACDSHSNYLEQQEQFEYPVPKFAYGFQSTFTILVEDESQNAVKVTYDWGDGTKTKAAYTQEVREIRLQHTYNDYGVYDITLTATNSKGTRSKTTTIDIQRP